MQLANNLLAQADVWIFTAFGVFLRIGAAAFFLPGIGERSIPVRVKIGLTLSFALIVFPIIQPDINTMPARLTWTTMLPVFFAEAVIGMAIGVAVRSMVYALQTAGMLIGQSLSLSQMFGVGVGPEPEPTIGTILTMGGIVLALVIGLHVKLTLLLSNSYMLLPFGLFPPGQDIGRWAIQTMSRLFSIAISLSLPFIVISFMYNLSLGLINRAMPQLMVVFVGMPFITGAGLLMLSLLIPVMLTVWSGQLDATLLDPFFVER